MRGDSLLDKYTQLDDDYIIILTNCLDFVQCRFKKIGNSFVKGQYVFTILKEEEDGIFVQSNMDTYPKILFLLKNPIATQALGKEMYTLCYQDKTIISRMTRTDKLVQCNALKFASPIIGKNACASVIASALYYDNKIDKEYIKNENKNVWETNPQLIHNFYTYMGQDNHYYVNLPKDMILFCVISDPLDRFIRFLNWNRRDSFRHYLHHNQLTYSQIIDEALFFLPYLQKSLSFVYDEHAIFQKNIIINTEKFLNRTAELVPIKTLPEWFKNKFGVDFIRSNVSLNSQRIFNKDMMTKEQKSLFYDIARDDYDFFDIRGIQFDKEI